MPIISEFFANNCERYVDGNATTLNRPVAPLAVNSRTANHYLKKKSNLITLSINERRGNEDVLADGQNGPAQLRKLGRAKQRSDHFNSRLLAHHARRCRQKIFGKFTDSRGPPVDPSSSPWYVQMFFVNDNNLVDITYEN